jgi:hypothetical protein
MAPLRLALVASALAGTVIALVASCTSGTTPDCSDAQCGSSPPLPEGSGGTDAVEDGGAVADGPIIGMNDASEAAPANEAGEAGAAVDASDAAKAADAADAAG